MFLQSFFGFCFLLEKKLEWHKSDTSLLSFTYMLQKHLLVYVQHPLSIQFIFLPARTRLHYAPQIKAISVCLLLIAAFITALAKNKAQNKVGMLCRSELAVRLGDNCVTVS